MQRSLDHWEGGLRVSGGALSPAKSFWYLLDYRWTGTTWRHRTIDEMPGDITLKGDDRVPVPLTRRNPDHSEKTLGVHFAPDGNQKGQIAYLKAKIAA